MNTLIIITGISGSGKSTVANQLYKEIKDSTLVQVDTIKEFMYELTGFIDAEDKKRLNAISYELFKNMICNCMERKDTNIIVEYPFKPDWAEQFSLMATKYIYNIIVVNVLCGDYDNIWKRLEKRNNSKDRHPSHSIEQYNIREKGKHVSVNELDKAQQEKSYYTRRYTSLNIGEEINYESCNSTSIEELIRKIDNERK